MGRISFQETKLGNVLEFYNGKSIKAGDTGTYPVYGSNGIIGGSEEYIYSDGLVIGRVGAYCGSVEYCPSKFWASDNTIVAKLKIPKDNILCIFYLLKVLNLNRYAGGSAQPLLTQTTLKQISIRIPSPVIQKKIAFILSRYDNLIENNTRRIKILEEMAQLIYKEWFVKFRFPGHENVKMVDSGTEFGTIPDGWEVRRLADVCNIVMGQSPKSKFYNENGDGLPFHQGVSNFGSRFPIDTVYCTVANRIAEHGDILFSVRAPVGRINLSTKKIIIGRGLCSIRSKYGYNEFIFQQLKEQFKEEDSMGGGTIFKAVTKEDMHGIKLIYPDQNITGIYQSILRPIFSQLEILQSQIDNLRQTRDLLLPKLISGEIDVENMGIDIEETEA